jgi:demethylmenaquinone methyltransferase/2-methoxy-6-polyprenyl-1,4-benzoquinol methylase
MVRVVRPGGRVVVLELVEPEGRGLGRLARFHVHHVVPRLGGWVSGSREYRHLQQSIEAFPPPTTFSAWMNEAGLVDVSAQAQTFGVAYIFAGTVAGGTTGADGAP